jgi:hypothetical protein
LYTERERDAIHYLEDAVALVDLMHACYIEASQEVERLTSPETLENLVGAQIGYETARYGLCYASENVVEDIAGALARVMREGEHFRGSGAVLCENAEMSTGSKEDRSTSVEILGGEELLDFWSVSRCSGESSDSSAGDARHMSAQQMAGR